MADRIKKIAWILYPLISFVLSFWAWRILKYDTFVFFLSLISTVLFFLILRSQATKVAIKVIFLIILAGVTLLIIPKHLDKSLWENSSLDIMQINTRRSYYPPRMGAIFQNKISQSLIKYESNLLTLVDINFYFFGSHPRERAGVIEFEKYFPLFLPFLILGLFQVIKKKFSLICVLVVLILSALIDSNYILGPVVIFPIFTAVLATGEEKFFEFAKNYKK